MAKKAVASLPVEFSKEVRAALQTTANNIWPDAGQFCTSNEELAEMVLDADRVFSAGFKGEAAELTSLIRAHGYPRVLKSAAKLLNYV